MRILGDRGPEDQWRITKGSNEHGNHQQLINSTIFYLAIGFKKKFLSWLLFYHDRNLQKEGKVFLSLAYRRITEYPAYANDNLCIMKSVNTLFYCYYQRADKFQIAPFFFYRDTQNEKSYVVAGMYKTCSQFYDKTLSLMLGM